MTLIPSRPAARLRRLIALAAAVSATGLLVGSTPAGAQSTQSLLDRARREASQIRTERDRIADAFAEAEIQHHHTEEQIAETTADIRRVQSEVGDLQESLKDRVRAAYRMRGIGFFQFLLEARSFSDFNLRLVSLQRQTLADEDVILKLRKKRHDLDVKEKQLAAQSAELRRRTESLREEGRRTTINLAQANSLVRKYQGILSREQIARLFSISRTTGGRVIPLAACPVDPPNVVTNSWGAPRGGGTRRHQGNDIMASTGTPIRAVNSGTITRTSNGGLGGIALYLQDGSAEYYYAHLSRLSVGSGQRVSAGALVGYNGSTGNAAGGPPHLHFEIHPGGGSAIDPYPSLSAVC
jgi:murein DD-endopeptidase MepM/ murein hydrolase activator NlpD